MAAGGTLGAPLGPFAARGPTLARTTPIIGDTQVDPALATIVITFDQDMQTSGYSITGGGVRLPEVLGKPRWMNDRTIVLRVRLLPEHEYEFGINSQRFRNFRSREGVPVEPVRFWFRTRPSAQPRSTMSEEQKNRNGECWQELLIALRERYSYYELREINWVDLSAVFEAEILAAAGTEEWVQRVARFLSSAQDVHIHLAYEGKRVPTYRRFANANYNLQYIQTVVPDLQGTTEVFAFGRTSDNIGYLLISTWGEALDRVFEDLLGALDALKDTTALILDVRPNSGGSELLARRVAARFIRKPVVYARSEFRLNASASGSKRVVDRIVEPANKGEPYLHPVLVLSGPRVMSSCEAFLLMMKQVPGCRLAGERSYCSSGNPHPTTLSNGVVVYLPSWKALDPEGRCIEGKGIEPDLRIKAPAQQFADSDPVLITAFEVLRKEGEESRK